MARQYSRALLGIHIEAIYHTSIVIDNREWYFGAGIQSSSPGSTHHGAPIEVLALGTSSLPADVIHEYITSMRQEYTPESYDLFLHNCNNFSADLAMFLCGIAIPEKIKNLPQDVLNTPFGQMIKPMLEQQLTPITTARVEPEATVRPPSEAVRTITSVAVLEAAIKDAPCVAAFFTSATCPPCRIVYPHFEQLAAEIGSRGVFIKADIGMWREVGLKYQVSATPTFITWSRGQQLDRWTGGNPTELKSNIDMLLRVTYPAHPHTLLSIPTTLRLATRASNNPTTFPKIPPLDKLLPRLGAVAQDPAVASLISFLQHRATRAPIPNEPAWASFLQNALTTLPPATLFPLLDLFRASLSDARISGWFAEEQNHATVKAVMEYAAREGTPYNIRLVTTQALVNLFTSPLFPPHLCAPPLVGVLVPLVSSFLLDAEHPHLRVAASALAFKVCEFVQRERSVKGVEELGGEWMVELGAGMVEALRVETASAEAVTVLALSVALLAYCVPEGEEVAAVFKAVEAGEVVRGKRGVKGVEQGLLVEVGRLVDGKA